MLLDDPVKRYRFNAAMHELTDLADNHHEFYLLIAFIRLFFEVEAEYTNPSDNALRLIKTKED